MEDIENLLARIAKLIDDPALRTGGGSHSPVLDTYSPVSLEVVESAEAVLGFRLPELLRQCYLRVGNGGFGPSHGIIGLEDGYPDDLYNACLPELYEGYRENRDDPDDDDPYSPWPEGVLPLFVAGCGNVNSIDCLAEGYPLVEMDNGLHRTQISLYEYMSQWVTEMEQKQSAMDPQ